MLPLSSLTPAVARRIDAVFTDIDGTLTDAHGRIPASVFAAIERARGAGLRVVPITGRPAGWCDMIARTWPVDGVVGENGGLRFRVVERDGQESMERVYAQDAATRRANRLKLDALAEQVLREVPGTALASDQQYREFDLAIDFCEDVPALDDAAVDRIVSLCRAAGCTVKVSNIHVNTWFGAFDKGTTCVAWARDVWGWDLRGADADRAIFFGDSPNDAPLFDLFPVSVGVANVARMKDRIDPLPTYVADGEGADGFIEGMERVLGGR